MVADAARVWAREAEEEEGRKRWLVPLEEVR